MSSSRNESMSTNYNVKVTPEWLNITEITQVNTGDSITFHNESVDPITLNIPRGLSGTLSVTIASNGESMITVSALDEMQEYSITDNSALEEPATPIALKIKMGGGTDKKRIPRHG